jgi:protein-disulfide isomerase
LSLSLGTRPRLSALATRRDQKDQRRAERLRREAEGQAKARRRRSILYGGGAVLLAASVLTALIIVSQSGGGSGGNTKIEGVAAVEQQLKGVPQHNTVLGDSKAKATVVEFGDLQCPVCQAFSTRVAPRLISDVVRKGAANYEFRQYTIIGPQSTDAAKAAYAAGEQNRYWDFVELFYLNQGTENSGYVTDGFLTAIAKGAGVRNIAKWSADRQSSKWDAELSRTQAEAGQLGFNGTPSILVEGPGGKRPFTGNVVPSLTEIENAIKAVE